MVQSCVDNTPDHDRRFMTLCAASALALSLWPAAGCLSAARVFEREQVSPRVQAPRHPLAPSSGRAPSALPASISTLEGYIDVALVTHPSLRVHHARWTRQAATARAALRRSNPSLMYSFAPLPIETRLGAQRHIISLEQPLAWPGQEVRASDVWLARAEAQAATFDATYLAIRHDVSQQYWVLWYTQRALTILAEQQILLEGLEQGARAQVEVGRQPGSVLSRIAIKRVQLDERIRIMQSDAQVRRVLLLTALGLTCSPDEEGVTLTSEPLRPAQLEDVDALIARHALPPHLLALAHQTRSEREALELARLKSLPTFQIGAQWSIIDAHETMAMPEAGRDALMLKVGLSLPVWQDASSAEVDAAEAAIVESEASEELARLTWTQRLRTTHALVTDLQRQLEVHETTLLPMASSSFDMVRGDYEVERAEFTAVLETLDTLLMVHLARLELRMKLAQALATWEWLKGHPVASTLTQDAP